MGEKNPVGRPTKYDPFYIGLIDEYISTTGKEQMTLPKREGYAKYAHINLDTIVEWEKIHPDFSVAINRLDQAQKEQLMDDGLYGGKEVNSTMAIFLLKVNHGMIETEKRILAGDPEHPLVNLGIGGPVAKIDGHEPVKLPDGHSPLPTKTD